MRHRGFVILLSVAATATASGLLPASTATAATTASHWSIQPSPNPPGSLGSALSAVSCTTDGSCTAVGEYSMGSGLLTLAERWDGSNWTVEQTPSPPGATSLLTGVSCPAPRFCVAVGYSVTTKVRPLVEHWDGSSWTIVHTPRPGRAWWFELLAVSCPSIGDCSAVGSSIASGVDAQERPLAEHWDGASWTIQRTPNPHAENGSGLTGVACGGAGVCEAVGFYVYGDVDESILAMGRNGTKWAIQQQPDPGGGYVTTDASVSCSGATACTSVGSWNDADGRTRALADSWDGASWIMQHARVPAGAAIAELFGVSCSSPIACIAVGDWSANFNGNPSATLAERWNGSAWRVQSTPNPKGATYSRLGGVDRTPAGVAVAVGSAYVDGLSITLVEVSAP
jgi:hypothetical protein